MPGILQKAVLQFWTSPEIALRANSGHTQQTNFFPCSFSPQINSMVDLKDSRKHRKEKSQYRLMTVKQTGKIYQFSGSYKNVTGRIDKKKPKA